MGYLYTFHLPPWRIWNIRHGLNSQPSLNWVSVKGHGKMKADGVIITISYIKHRSVYSNMGVSALYPFIIIMGRDNKRRRFAISLDNQSHGPSVCSRLNYGMERGHTGVYLLVFCLLSPIIFARVSKLSSVLLLITCPKNVDTLRMISLINLAFSTIFEGCILTTLKEMQEMFYLCWLYNQHAPWRTKTDLNLYFCWLYF